MNYRILPAAQQDLRHIDDWIAAQFGDAVADRARKRIYDIFDLPPAFRAWVSSVRTSRTNRSGSSPAHTTGSSIRRPSPS
jgi:plasmid stabilization system protein ParE